MNRITVRFVGRTRKHKADSWMPPRVYRGKTAYEFHPKGGGSITLCPLDSSRAVVWAKYEQFNRPQTANTIDGLWQAYEASPQFKSKAFATQKTYRRRWKFLSLVFGRMKPDSLKPEHVRKYMDERGKEVAANREKALLSKVFSWGYERGHCKSNPCKGIIRFTETPRDRYVTDKEYEAVYRIARENIKAAMEISYLCAARMSDVLKLTVFDLKDEGVYIKQGKTGKKQIKAWNPRLRAAVELARAQPAKKATSYVIHTQSGDRYTLDGFSGMWREDRDKAGESGFTFHDLKAKGVSDYEGDKKKFSGHSSDKMVAIYDRKTEVVDALNVPNISDDDSVSN